MNDAFTEDDLSESAKWGSLGPEYFAARKLAEDFMAKFKAEQFKPMVDSFVDAFRDKLWSDIDSFLLSDTESNLHTGMARMVEASVNALLSGEGWAMQRYPLSKNYDADKVRKAIAEHIGDDIVQARIADLEKQIEGLKQSLEWARR